MQTGALGMTMVLSGCPIWIDTEEVDHTCRVGCDDPMCHTDFDCPAGHFCSDGDCLPFATDDCTSNEECEVGEFCNRGECMPTWICEDGSCPPGYVCDERGTCVPGDEPPPPCTDNADCPGGYCDIQEGATEGTCVDTGNCGPDGDCSMYGPGMACDERNICVPDEGPCPDGECGCIDDSECDSSQLCIASLCTDPDTVCFFNVECGDGACVDNECHARCDATTTCPIGQGCELGYCQDLAVGLDGCVYDEECGETGFRCINATCHPTCETAETCGEGETCASGVCRADGGPIHNCTDASECDTDMGCVRGVCRMPCVSPLNCDGATPVCGGDGFCISPSEVEPDCVRASDCADSAVCVDGLCQSFDA